MKILDMKIRQQLEQASEARVSQEQQIWYEEFYRKLRNRKSFSQAELNELRQNRPAFYEMVQSLEREVQNCERRLEDCVSREEVRKLKKDYQEEILLAARSVEINPLLPWEKKLEYILFKDTKISVIEELIENFMGSNEYDRIPEEAEADEKAETADAKEPTSGKPEVSKETSILYARAKAGYDNFGRFAEEEPDPALRSGVSFEAKG